MLNTEFNACNATNHSPEREQRLLSFAHDADHELTPEHPEVTYSQARRNEPEDISRDVHEKIRNVLESSDQAEVVHGNETRPKGPEFFFNAGDDFVKRFLMAKIVEAQSHQNIDARDQLWHQLETQELAVLKQQATQYDIGFESDALPSAFIYGNRVYFDASRDVFSDRTLRERMLMHEFTHFELDQETHGKNNLDVILMLLKKAEAWPILVQEVEAIMPSLAQKNERDHADEIVAIYLAGRMHPFEKKDQGWNRICDILHKECAGNPALSRWIETIEKKAQRYVFESSSAASVAAKEQQDQRAFRSAINNAKVRTNSDETEQLDPELTQSGAVEEETQWTFSEVNIELAKHRAKELLHEVNDAKSRMPAVSTNISQFDAERQPELSGSAEAIQHFLDDNGTTLVSFGEYLEDLQRLMRGELSDSEKAELQEFWNVTNIDDNAEREKILNMINGVLAMGEQEMKRVEDFVGKLGTPFDQPSSSPVIVWRSPKNIWEGFKVTWEALKDAWAADENRRKYDVAKSMTGALKHIPYYGQPIVQALNRQARASNDEETSKFADYLKSEGFLYDELIAPNNEDSVMNQNRGSVNRMKAIVEYAADHGWLYHVNWASGHNIYGLDFETHFGIQSVLELQKRNDNGKDAEVKRGEEKVKMHPEISMIIHDMHEELKKKNVYAIRGMLQVLQNKAKIGESNTWGLTTLIRAMRRDPDLLGIIDIGLLDNIGGIGIGQAAWALTLFKTQRKQFLAWRQRGGREENFDSDESFVIAGTIKKIESKLPNNMTQSDNPMILAEIDRAVAMVLSGQTYRKHGVVISIFDQEFKDYRDYYDARATSIDVGKTDDDFFNPANNTSDVLLLSADSIGIILQRQSQGPYIHELKARGFLAMTLLREYELRDTPRLHAAYVLEMRTKLETALRKTVIQDAARKQLPSEIAPKYDPDSDIPHIEKFSKVNLLDGLYKAGLVSAEFYKDVLMEQPDKTYSELQKESVRGVLILKKQQELDKITAYVNNARRNISAAKYQQAMDHIGILQSNLTDIDLKDLKETTKEIRTDLPKKEQPDSAEVFNNVLGELVRIREALESGRP